MNDGRLADAWLRPHQDDKSEWTDQGPADPLAVVVRAWPTLPNAIKAGILAMVTASGKD